MITPPRWDPCVGHRGRSAEQFMRDYFGQRDRRLMLIGGAGFDLRTTRLAEAVVATAADRVSGLFLREDRPSPRPELLDRADKNEQRLLAA